MGTGMQLRLLFPLLSSLVLSGFFEVSFAEDRVMEIQQDLLLNQINALYAERKGISDMYFIGFAPYSTEDVFMNEATYVRNLFDLQYDTVHRSILLVNNPKTLEMYPVANLKNLEKVFEKIGSLINPDEDIVVLYITSHGKKDQGISLNFDNAGDLAPEREYLDASTLKKLFDENHIQWRTLFILACFSGGMIEKLKDENTVIITSASRERSSFGCGHHGDFTQFGEVMFHDNLRNTRDFVSSFNEVSQKVAILEKSEGLIPSQPQLYIGNKIRRLLDELFQN